MEQLEQQFERIVASWGPRLSAWSGRDGRRLRKVLLCLGAMWLLLAMAQVFWALVPSAAPAPALNGPSVNPLSTSTAASASAPVPLDKLTAWHLFGEAGEQQTVVEPVPVQTVATDDIEEGAKETKLSIKLTGVVAVSDEGLGMAILEHQRQQQVYVVGDVLPVGGDKVKLAKVLADRVVIDNRGTYELILLFDEDAWSASAQTPAVVETAPVVAPPATTTVTRDDPGARRVANNYRQRLYSDPQSLAKVVKISAARVDGQLRGYRVSPGSDKEQFTQLGFQSGDLVTSVNGVSLDNPANAVQLYQLMRTATEAVFTVERGGQETTLTVALGNE